MPPILMYAIGVVTAPLFKPLLRRAAKATVGLGLQAKKLAAEAREDLEDLTAEMNAEVSTTQSHPRS
jgi:hypothetical protein